MGFLDWFAATFQGRAAEIDADAERQAEFQAAQGAERRPALERERERYYGTSTPVVDEHGAPVEQTVRGTESHDSGGWGWSWLQQAYRRVTGETTTATSTDPATGEVTRRIDEERTSTAVGAGGLTASSTERDITQTRDVRGMASAAKAELQAQLEGDLGATLTPAERARIEADIQALSAEGVDDATLRRVIADHRLRVREQFATAGGTESSATGSVTREGLGARVAGSSSDTVHRGVGDSTTTTVSGAVHADALAGTAGAEGRYSTAETRDGQTTTDAVHGSASVAAGGGNLTLTGTAGASTMTTEGERQVSGASVQESGSLSIVGGERGTGFGAGRTSTASVTADDVTLSRETSTTGAITNRGVFAGTSTERRVGHREHGSVTSRTSADGSFTVDLEAIPGSFPTQYRVTMRLSATAGLRLSGEGRRGADDASTRGRATATAGASAGATLTYRHVMTDEEVARYMEEVDAADAGAAAGSKPEFGMIGRLRSLGDHADEAAIGGAAVLGSAEAGAQLGDGESVELTLTGSVDVGGSLGGNHAGFGVTGQASRSDSWTRTVRLARVGDAEAAGRHLVDVTVSYVEADRWSAGGTASFEGATAGYSHSESGSETQSVTIRLDTAAPDYASRYAAVCAATDPIALRGLAHEYTIASSETSGDTVTAGAVGVTAIGGTTTALDESVTLGQGGAASGTFAGGQTDTASIGVGIVRPSESERNTATVTVDEAGTEATLETESASTDLGRSISEGASAAWSAITGVFDGEGSAVEETASIVTRSPQERLQEQLATTYADLEQYQLSEGDLDTIVSRAGNRSNWEWCCMDLDTFPIWQGLRTSLLSPSIDPEWSQVDAAQAARLARGRTLARFMRDTGADGMDCMVNVLRYYGQRGGYTSAQDLGTHLEWPESLSAARGKYDTAHRRIRRADQELAPLIGRPDGVSRAEAWAADTRSKLDEAEAAIRASADITDRSARMEMLDAILRERSALDEAIERNRHALEVGAPESGPAESTAEPAVCTTEDALLSVGPEPTPEQARAQRRIGELVGLLAGYKSEEQAQFGDARNEMTTEAGGTLEGWTAVFRSDYREASAIVGYRMSQLYENWITKIVELRGLYETAATPVDQWVVSRAAGERRNPHYEPDVERRIEIYRAAIQQQLTPDISWQDHVAAWRRQVESY